MADSKKTLPSCTLEFIAVSMFGDIKAGKQGPRGEWNVGTPPLGLVRTPWSKTEDCFYDLSTSSPFAPKQNLANVFKLFK